MAAHVATLKPSDYVYLNPSPHNPCMCAACGRYPVERPGQLCNQNDTNDPEWMFRCAWQSARWMAVRLGIDWPIPLKD